MLRSVCQFPAYLVKLSGNLRERTIPQSLSCCHRFCETRTNGHLSEDWTRQNARDRTCSTGVTQLLPNQQTNKGKRTGAAERRLRVAPTNRTTAVANGAFVASLIPLLPSLLLAPLCPPPPAVAVAGVAGASLLECWRREPRLLLQMDSNP